MSPNPKGSSSTLRICFLTKVTKKLIQNDLRLDTTRKNDLHYAERWSQDRGSLSPTTQSPQRSRFYITPLNFLNFFKPHLRSSSRSPRPEARRTSALRKGRNHGYTRSCASHILSVLDRRDDQYQTSTLPCVSFLPQRSKTYPCP